MIPRYNRPKIDKIWSNNNKFKIWTKIECLVSEKLANLGEIPKQAAIDIINRNPNLDEKIVREELEGNLCRCTGYQNIVKSILAAANK